MRELWIGGLGVALGLCAATAQADDVIWRPVVARSAIVQPYAAGLMLSPATPGSPIVTLGRPVPLDAPANAGSPLIVASYTAPDIAMPQPIFRAQAGDIPPPAPPPGVAPAVPAPAAPPFATPVPPLPPGSPPAMIGPPNVGAEPFNNGVVTAPPQPNGMNDIFGGMKRLFCGECGCEGGRKRFESDHCFDDFVSPLSNPFYFEDPRALTEVRPIFIYQSVPTKNQTGGGDIEFFGVQGRLALTDRFSIVLNELGGIAFQPDHPNANSIFQKDQAGFAEIKIGPKYTFLRSESWGTIAAAGLTFDLPVGSKEVFQDTGDLSLIPYVTVGQRIAKSFHVLGTLGYSAAVDNDRTDFLFGSLHLDYDVANIHKIYPLLELNWFHYTSDGKGANGVTGFEGRDLFNFGATGVKGHDEVSLAAGVRLKPLNEHLEFGAAAEFPLTNQKDLMEFRLMLDVIFRY